MKKFNFEVKDFDSGGRITQITVGSKMMETPNLFPVIHPFRNVIPPKRLYNHFKAQAAFTNAYIIYKNDKYREIVLKKGVHKHLGFPGIIATDSGGFQDYMYSDDIALKPEEIESFQEEIGSDCPVILDIPVQTDDPYEEAKRKVETTIARAKDNITRRKREEAAWFGPVHGSVYPDLVKRSARAMSQLDFGFYPIGGVVKTFIDYRFNLSLSILLEAKKHLRPDRPVHMFGLGLPAFFSLAVACGADTFDSAAYVLFAEDGRYFTATGTKHISELREFPCHCPVCTKNTPKEVRSLNKKEKTRLLAEHNLYHSFSELRIIREAIREGSLWDLVEQRVHAHPKLMEGLRVIKDFPEYFDQHLNLSKNKGQNYLGRMSFHRAVFRRFRNKVKKFRFAPEKKRLLLLPELDLPSTNGRSMLDWLKEIRSLESYPSIQIVILSCLLGPIPLELSEMYPAAQHVGQGNMLFNIDHRHILLGVLNNVISNNLSLEKVDILIPNKYTNEYGVESEFKPETHLIGYVAEYIQSKFSNLTIERIETIDSTKEVSE